MPETPSPTDVVHTWLAAVNAGDVEGVIALTAADVTVAGPRGTGRGHDALRGWLAHAWATFETRAVYAGGGAVVVAQRGVWRDVVTGEVRVEAEMATRFRVVAGEVSEIQRYDDLDAALRDAGLDGEGSRVVRNESKGL